jgi:hypothetical protein
MSAYREGAPPPPDPPEPPDRDYERLMRATLRRKRVVTSGPYVAMALLVGLVWIGLGWVSGALSAVATGSILLAGYFGERLSAIKGYVSGAVLLLCLGLWTWGRFGALAAGVSVAFATLVALLIAHRMARQTRVPRPPAVIEPPRARVADEPRVRVAPPEPSEAHADDAPEEARAKGDVSV